MSEPIRSLSALDPLEAWKPWTPSATDPWNRKWAGHLYRRAAFGATWEELETAVEQGFEGTLEQLLCGGEGYDAFDHLMDSFVQDSRFTTQEGDAESLQNWWLYRILHTLHPFQERMTLFWHNHFATSIVKVRWLGLMVKQNSLLRKHALGKFRPFLQAISRDPAMLIWLDSNSNVKAHPNENYARELLELFSLGVGHYSEQDIRAVARAFTGWHTTASANGQSSEFAFRTHLHDDGPKTVLGRTGNWDGDDVIRLILEQPAAARFLVRKLFRHFINESETPPDRLLEPLADQFRRSDYDLMAVMRTLLRSRLFFSDLAYRQRIKGPVEYLVGLLRSLESPAGENGRWKLPPDTLQGLGQTLFAPPSVKGWDGGRAWLNSATLLARHNLAWHAVQGKHGPLKVPVNLLSLVEKHAGQTDTAKQVDFLFELLLQPDAGEVDAQARQKLVVFLSKDQPHGQAWEERIRETTHAVLTMPWYQLN
jgi:uncharacterized protein (DUF1800 family)